MPTERPTIWVNCACSADGRLALAAGRRLLLSSPEDLVRVQRLRAQSDAVLVGSGTVLADDPSLRVHWDLLREPPGREPIRIVLDGRGRLDPRARVFDGSAPTIVVTRERQPDRWPPHVTVLPLGPGPLSMERTFHLLQERGIRSVLVEGGSSVLGAVVREQQFDRWTIYYAPVLVRGSEAPSLVAGPTAADPSQLDRLRLESVAPLGDGLLATYLPPA